MNDNKKSLLEEFEKAAKIGLVYQKCCEKDSVLERVMARLFKFKYRYLKCLYSYSIGINKPLLLSAKTFWNEIFYCSFPESADIYLTGLLSHPAELKLTLYLIKHLPEDCIFFDAGAHYGFYTLLAKKLIKEGKVHSFEPSPNNFNILKKNTANKAGIIINNVALYDRRGEILFYELPKAYSGSSTIIDIQLLQGQGIFFRELNCKKIQVPAITLDEYCRNNHVIPDFIKIDVEGAESHVINGAINVLISYNPILSLEIWKPPRPNKSHLQAIETLSSLGYKSYFINENGELEQEEKLLLMKDPRNKNENLDNFIFKKE